jgi:hypothetical protein
MEGALEVAMPTPGEHKTVHPPSPGGLRRTGARILKYAETIGWTIVSREDAERRRRSLKVGARTIEFRERSRRKMAAAGRASGLVMAGLRSLGQEHVTPETVAHLKKLLKPADRRRLLDDLRLAPAWMHPHLRKIAEEKS